MKTITIHIHDDAKAQLVINFLKEINFMAIEETQHSEHKIKKMRNLPNSILHPVKSKQFKIYNRDELHDRQDIC